MTGQRVVVAIPGARYCYKCGLAKPVQDFGRDKTRRSGFSRWCRECTHTMNADYYSRRKKLTAKDS